MQTFLPKINFDECADVLDRQRLHKQIIECYQIDDAIFNHLNGVRYGWQAHPVTLMWYEYRHCLYEYRYAMEQAYKRRFRSTVNLPYNIKTNAIYDPDWLGCDRLHNSHAEALRNKFAGSTETNYYWPGVSDVKYPSFGPMLARSEMIPLDKITFPKYASFKLDGMRCIIYDGEMFTRNLKLHPNKYLRDRFKDILEVSVSKGLVFDTELYDHDLNFNSASSVIRTHAGELSDNLSMHIIDQIPLSHWERGGAYLPFDKRLDLRINFVHPHVVSVHNYLVKNLKELDDLYKSALSQGYEGLIVRNPKSYYKYGRVTDQDMLKLKERHTEEAVIIDITQGRVLKEDVSRTRDLKGHLNKVFTQDDYTLANMVGSFYVKCNKFDAKFHVGMGRDITMADRRSMWERRKELIGKTIEFEYMPYGVHEVPRMGKFVRFRPDKD